MITYFVAGWHQFSNGTKCHFWRVVNWTDKDTPHQFLASIYKELEDSSDNYKYLSNYGPSRGSVIITSFNKV